MKDAKRELEYLSSFPGIDILCAQHLSSTNASIGKLVIDSWDGEIIQIIRIHPKLNFIYCHEPVGFRECLIHLLYLHGKDRTWFYGCVVSYDEVCVEIMDWIFEY